MRAIVTIKSFPGHRGRHGKRGGSLPRNGIAEKMGVTTYNNWHDANIQLYDRFIIKENGTIIRSAEGATSTHTQLMAVDIVSNPDKYSRGAVEQAWSVIDHLDVENATVEHAHNFKENSLKCQMNAYGMEIISKYSWMTELSEKDEYSLVQYEERDAPYISKEFTAMVKQVQKMDDAGYIPDISSNALIFVTAVGNFEVSYNMLHAVKYVRWIPTVGATAEYKQLPVTVTLSHKQV